MTKIESRELATTSRQITILTLGLPFAPWWENRWIAVFRVALDDSGNQADRDVFVLAGLISSQDDWGLLESEWRETLIRHGVPKDETGEPVPFHMTDFESRYWPYDDGNFWTNKRRSDLISRLIGIMTRRVRARVWAVVSMRDWHKLSHPPGSDNLPYTICGTASASRVAAWADRYGNKEPISYLFERGNEGQGRTRDVLDKLAKTEVGSRYYIGPTSMGDKYLPTLQAADVHSYEVRKHFMNGFAGKARGMRRSFERLLEIPHAMGYLITGKDVYSWYKRTVTSGRNVGLDIEPMPLTPTAITRFGPTLTLQPEEID